MEISELERLVELVKGSNIGELTLNQGADRLTLKKKTVASPPSQEFFAPTSESYEEMVVSEYSDSLTVEEPMKELVFAPLVGIFSHVKPIVALGAKVKQGQTICVIEAMNIFSDVKSPVSGVVCEVLIEAGQPVEYGQILYEIRPD